MSSVVQATVNTAQTYYMPFYVSETTTWDLIGCRTGSAFSGTSSVRIGVYNNANGKPTTVRNDFGLLNFTTASTTAFITINETIDAGWYWLAFNAQTVTGTANFITSLTITGQQGNGVFPQNAGINFYTPCWQEGSITGAFATANNIGDSTRGIVVVLSKA
jgi:hypothetical protein